MVKISKRSNGASKSAIHLAASDMWLAVLQLKSSLLQVDINPAHLLQPTAWPPDHKHWGADQKVIPAGRRSKQEGREGQH